MAGRNGKRTFAFDVGRRRTGRGKEISIREQEQIKIRPKRPTAKWENGAQ